MTLYITMTYDNDKKRWYPDRTYVRRDQAVCRKEVLRCYIDKVKIVPFTSKEV